MLIFFTVSSLRTGLMRLYAIGKILGAEKDTQRRECKSPTILHNKPAHTLSLSLSLSLSHTHTHTHTPTHTFKQKLSQRFFVSITNQFSLTHTGQFSRPGWSDSAVRWLSRDHCVIGRRNRHSAHAPVPTLRASLSGTFLRKEGCRKQVLGVCPVPPETHTGPETHSEHRFPWKDVTNQCLKFAPQALLLLEYL